MTKFLLLVLTSINTPASVSALGNSEQEEAVFCTQDVKECPDGSYVGRDPQNNCEFFSCPEAEEDDES